LDGIVTDARPNGSGVTKAEAARGVANAAKAVLTGDQDEHTRTALCTSLYWFLSRLLQEESDWSFQWGPYAVDGVLAKSVTARDGIVHVRADVIIWASSGGGYSPLEADLKPDESGTYLLVGRVRFGDRRWLPEDTPRRRPSEPRDEDWSYVFDESRDCEA
jgi:hypothetical protein